MKNPQSENTVLWLRKGSGNYHAVRILMARREIDFSDQIHNLFGEALECWLKSILLSQEPGGKGLSLKEVTGRTHNIVAMGKECGLQLSNRALKFLQQVEIAVSWTGTYPCNKDGSILSYEMASDPGPEIEEISGRILMLLPESLRPQMVPEEFLPEVLQAGSIPAGSRSGELPTAFVDVIGSSQSQA